MSQNTKNMTLGTSSGHDDFKDSQIFCLTQRQMERTKLVSTSDDTKFKKKNHKNFQLLYLAKPTNGSDSE